MPEDLKALIREPGFLFGLSGEIALCTFPVLGVLGALVLLALRQYQYFILSIYLIIPVVIGPLVYRLTRGKAGEEAYAGDARFKFLVAGYLICFALSLTLLYDYDVRPTIYYVVIAAMAAIILAQILRFREPGGRALVILLQIVALTLNLSGGVTLKYFMYIGRTDILVHTFYVDSLVQLRHVTGVFFDYQWFPLWHILNAGIYLAGGAQFPTYKVMAITGGLAFATLPIVIYLIAMKLFKDPRIALIAALITILFPDLISMAASSIPRSIAEILMAFLIYLLLSEKSRAGQILILLTTLAIIVYHSVSILLIVMVLVVLVAIQRLFARNEEPVVRTRYVAFAIAMTVVYWLISYNSNSWVVDMLVHNVTAPTGGIVVPKALTENLPWRELFNYLQYVPAIAFVLVGIFILLLTGKYGTRAKIFGAAALLLIWLSFPGPLLMIGKLVYSFGIDRIAEYSFLILILAAAAGIAWLASRTSNRSKAIIMVIFAIWVLLSVSNDWVASDNPLVKRPFYTYYFTGQEVAGMDRLATHATGILESDYVAYRYLDPSPLGGNSTIMQVDVHNMTFVRSCPEDVLLIREGEHAKRELRGAALDSPEFLEEPGGERYFYVNRQLSVWDTLPGYCRVYDSAAIQAYTG